MVSVASLLNPVKDEQRQLPSSYSNSSTPPATPTSRLSSLVPQPFKKQKMSKDAAVFNKGNVKGEINYPPREFYDAKTLVELERFSVFPIGEIQDYPRHIPYNSDKKSFMQKTGRGAFEVFQYTFKLSSDDATEYTIMWDYNVGLVRITPFFKCCGYAKTMPSKMINNNPGLRDICHSITGGALVAQGYWLPFEAAKAVVATFCYDIRYVLVPLFGSDFVSLCVKRNAEGYGRMIIDQKIVRECTAKSREYREAASREATQIPSSTSTNFRTSPGSRLHGIRPRRLEFGSGYDTEVDRNNDNYLPTPHSPSLWTPRYQPRSIRDSAPLPSPRALFKSSKHLPHSQGALPNSPDSSTSNGTGVSPKTKLRELGWPLEPPHNALIKLADTACAIDKRVDETTQATPDIRAAYAIMQLHFADAKLGDHKGRSKKRRASN